MSAEHTAQEPAEDVNERGSAEKWAERVGSFWGHALVDAWRTVFPRREDTK